MKAGVNGGTKRLDISRQFDTLRQLTNIMDTVTGPTTDQWQQGYVTVSGNAKTNAAVKANQT
jgi:hypothetical protein